MDGVVPGILLTILVLGKPLSNPGHYINILNDEGSLGFS